MQGLATFSQAAVAENPGDFLAAWFPLRSEGSQPQAGLLSPGHQGKEQSPI